MEATRRLQRHLEYFKSPQDLKSNRKRSREKEVTSEYRLGCKQSIGHPDSGVPYFYAYPLVTFTSMGVRTQHNTALDFGRGFKKNRLLNLPEAEKLLGI